MMERDKTPTSSCMSTRRRSFFLRANHLQATVGRGIDPVERGSPTLVLNEDILREAVLL